MLSGVQIATEQDRKEAMARRRRQMAEMERKNRIFDPRTRVIGIDVRSLDHQMEERRMKEHMENEIDKEFDRQMLDYDKTAVLLMAKENNERVMVNREIDTYRKLHQRKEDAREFDIHDPKILQKTKSPRCSDFEEIPISAGQKFEGEDLRQREREKIMAQQKASWLKQQMNERENYEKELKSAEFAEKQSSISQDERALQLELIERRCKKEIALANERFNKTLAFEQSHKRKTNVQNEKDDNLAEIYNSLTSDLLTENPNAACSSYGRHRIIPYMYKGMSQREREVIKLTQMNQMEENKAKMNLEKKCESDWNELGKKLLSVATLSNEELEQKRRLTAIKIREENLKLASKQREKLDYFDRIVYKNEPTKDFFDKFNTTTR